MASSGVEDVLQKADATTTSSAIHGGVWQSSLYDFNQGSSTLPGQFHPQPNASQLQPSNGAASAAADKVPTTKPISGNHSSLPLDRTIADLHKLSVSEGGHAGMHSNGPIRAGMNGDGAALPHGMDAHAMMAAGPSTGLPFAVPGGFTMMPPGGHSMPGPAHGSYYSPGVPPHAGGPPGNIMGYITQDGFAPLGMHHRLVPTGHHGLMDAAYGPLHPGPAAQYYGSRHHGAGRHLHHGVGQGRGGGYRRNRRRGNNQSGHSNGNQNRSGSIQGDSMRGGHAQSEGPRGGAGRGRNRGRRGGATQDAAVHAPRFRLPPEMLAMGADELKGHVMEMSRDQQGCRLLQHKLEEGDAQIRDLIFEEIVPHASALMMDTFGNYLFQKMLDFSGPDDRMQLLAAVCECSAESVLQEPSPKTTTELAEFLSSLTVQSTTVVGAALDIHGTRSVQKMIEVCRRSDEVNVIVASLSKSIVRLCNDANGNHVVQRCLAHLPALHKTLIVDEIFANCLTVAKHRHGCCVLQRSIDSAKDEQRNALVRTVVANAVDLMQDPFGNYVVQYVLERGTWDDSKAIIEATLGRLVQLSGQKFSSNVVEKCLQIADEGLRDTMIKEFQSEEACQILLDDQYGNYVIQKALAVCTAANGTVLVDAVRPHLMRMTDKAVAKRIAAKIMKKFPDANIIIEAATK